MLKTIALDMRKHAFNYQWSHFSHEYLHWTISKRDMVNDASSNLLMCYLLRRGVLLVFLQYLCILLLNHARLLLWFLQQNMIVALSFFLVKIIASVVDAPAVDYSPCTQKHGRSRKNTCFRRLLIDFHFVNNLSVFYFVLLTKVSWKMYKVFLKCHFLK